MRVLQHFWHPAGCVAPSFPTTMAPWRGQSKGQRRQHSQPTEITQPQQQDIPEADPAQGSRATAPNINLPTTPIHQGGPFHVPQYNLHPLHLSLPLHLERTLTLQRQIPSLYPFPQQQVIYRHLSSVLVQLGETRSTCQQKSDLEVWGESDEDIIGMWQ